MNGVKKGIVAVLSLTLMACSKETAVSSVRESTKKEETTEWKYDGSETTLPEKRNEVIHVQADEKGNVIKTTADISISGFEDEKVIEDHTDLNDINNADGDEQLEVKDGSVYFENLGKSISYSGTSQKQLPVNVHITYYLDEKEVEPSELAGKTGHVRIRMNYENSTTYKDIHVPFMCMSFLMLDKDKFSDVKVTNGKTSDMDDSTLVLGYAMPEVENDINQGLSEKIELGVPSYVEIEADTSDFELEFTETVITKGLFSEIEEDDLKDVQKMTDSMSELGTAGNSLVEGGSALSKGYSQLAEGLKAYLDGMGKLNAGLKQIAEGSSSLNENAGKLVSALNDVNDSMTAMDIPQDKMSSLAGSAGNITLTIENMQALVQTISTVESSTEEILNRYNVSDEDKKSIHESFDSLLDNVSSLQMNLTDSVNTFSDSLSELDLSGFDQLKETMNQLLEGTTVLAQGISSLNEGIQTISSSTDETVKNNSDIQNALNQFETGMSEYLSGIQKVNEEALQKLSSKAGKEGRKILDKVRTLKEADQSYTSFCGDRTDDLSFMIETAKIGK